MAYHQPQTPAPATRTVEGTLHIRPDLVFFTHGDDCEPSSGYFKWEFGSEAAMDAVGMAGDYGEPFETDAKTTGDRPDWIRDLYAAWGLDYPKCYEQFVSVQVEDEGRS